MSVRETEASREYLQGAGPQCGTVFEGSLCRYRFRKNGFLHFWDAVPAAMDEQIEAVERKGGRGRQPRITSNDIPRLYPPGAEVIVQVNKGPIGTKGGKGDN